MKVYSLDKSYMPIVRQLFNGYIFRKTDEKFGYVKCSEKQKEKIENFGIKLTLV
jgi:hypothetical protein